MSEEDRGEGEGTYFSSSTFFVEGRRGRVGKVDVQRLIESRSKDGETLVSYRSFLEESVVRDEVRCDSQISELDGIE